MEPLDNYEDSDIYKNTTIFNDVTEYEFLEALKAEGIDSSEDIVESNSDTTYENRVRSVCDIITTYFYYKCNDPLKKEEPFPEFKGTGFCPRPRTPSSHRRPSSARRPRSSLPRGSSSSNGRTYSSRPRGPHTPLQELPHENRQVSRSTVAFAGYKFIRRHDEKFCKSTNGTFLKQIVSEFVLKGKKEKYQKVIERTFQRIRRRYKGNAFMIQSETFTKNGKVFVRFFFNEDHTKEAEF